MSVVLGYDDSPGSSAALETAILVAQRFDEELVLVYGVAPPGELGEEFKAHRDAITELARAATAHAVEAAEKAGVTTRVQLIDAKPAAALIEAAEACDATVIVVGVSGESPLRGAMLGATPHKLLQLSTRPVLCVPVGD